MQSVIIKLFIAPDLCQIIVINLPYIINEYVGILNYYTTLNLHEYKSTKNEYTSINDTMTFTWLP